MQEKKTRKANYHIFAFMREMGLTSSALSVYALLYSFTKSEAGLYYGSQNALAEMLGISVRTVQRVYRELLLRGYIERVRVGKFCGYKCVYGVQSAFGTSETVPYNKESAPEKPSERSERIERINEEKSTPEASEALNKENTPLAVCEAERGVITEKSRQTSPSPTDKAQAETKKTEPLQKGARNERSECPGDLPAGDSRAREGGNFASDDAWKFDTGGKNRHHIEKYKRYIYACESEDEDDKDEPPELLFYRNPNPKYKIYRFGRYKHVALTADQYNALCAIVDSDTVDFYIAKCDLMRERNMQNPLTAPPAPHSFYRTIKSWLHRDFGT